MKMCDKGFSSMNGNPGCLGGISGKNRYGFLFESFVFFLDPKTISFENCKGFTLIQSVLELPKNE